MIRFGIFLQIFIFLSTAGPVFAADAASSDVLIQQALDLRRDGKPEEALKLFQRAHSISPSARTFGQMGLVETSLTRWIDADLHLSVALTSPDDPWVIKNRAFLEQALATTKLHIGDVVISGPAGVEVFVGGKSVGTLPAVPPVHLVEGAVSVSATAAGFKPFDQTIVIRAGARSSVEITLSPIATENVATAPAKTPAATSSLSAAAPAPVVVGGARNSWHTWAGASIAAAGAGLLTWGIVWIAIDNNDACGSTQGPACGTAYNTKTPGWILAGVGTAALVGGAVVFFTGRDGTAGSNVALGFTPSSFVLRTRF
jgi:hypothetical protein